ncbi:MAG: hypothetical protein IPG78_03725 [Ignavibacteria bacterium]|nr:hypothetical protein [Ignavibacteria bacterium]
MEKTVICDIKDNRFSPIVIEKDTYVVWRNLDSIPHSAETLPGTLNYFNAGPLFPNDTSSPIYFSKEGVFNYICRFHRGMNGVVKVTAAGKSHHETNDHDSHDHHDHHGKHFHGFVTGGRSSQQLFMTHTPVLADSRHHFQVILQASLPNPIHAAAYDALRNSSYGNGKVQIFHNHMALTDIRDGILTVLPESSFEYYPNDPDGILGGESVAGLDEKFPCRLTR